MREKGKIMIFFRDFPKKWEIYLKLKKNEKEKKKRLKRFAKIKKKYYWKKKDTPFYLKKVKDVPEKKSHMVVLFVLLEVAKDLKFMPIANAVFCKHMRTRPQVWCADFFFSSPECGVYEAILLGFTGKEILNPLPPTRGWIWHVRRAQDLLCKSILKMHLKNLRL